MMRKRIEVFIDVLGALQNKGGLRITELMREANVTHRALQNYLPFCLAERLAYVDSTDYTEVTYHILPTGVALHKALRKFYLTQRKKTPWIIRELEREKT